MSENTSTTTTETTSTEDTTESEDTGTQASKSTGTTSTGLSKDLARERVRAVMHGKDPDKVAKLPKKDDAPVVAAAKKATKPKPKAPVEKPAEPAAAAPAAPEATPEPETPVADIPEKTPVADTKDPPVAKERAELAKEKRAVRRDAERLKAREQQIEQAERAINAKWAEFEGEDLIEKLEAHYRETGKDLRAAVRKWAAKGKEATPGQPAAQVTPAAPAVQQPQADPEIEELKAFKRKVEGEKVARTYIEKYTNFLKESPLDPAAFPILSEIDEGWLADTMLRTAKNYYDRTGVELDAEELCDMIEKAEQQEQKALDARRKRKLATTSSGPEREPAGRSQTHEPSKANTVDVSSRARAGSRTQTAEPGEDPKKVLRPRLREILRAHSPRV